MDQTKCTILFFQGEFELFDSLGVTGDEVKARIGPVGRCHFNESAVQSPGSKSCGIFSLYFAFVRLANLDLDFNEVINAYFTSDPEKNERIVSCFWKTGDIHDPFVNIPHPKSTK